MLRVAHLLPNLAVGGRERMANALCQAGGNLGIASTLIGYDPLPEGASVLPAAAPYWQLDRRQGDFSARLRGLLADQRIDVVHAQGHIPACYLAKALAGWRTAPASLATMHVGMQGTWRWLWQIRCGLRAMDAITAVSAPLAQSYARIAGRPVAVLGNGIDTGDFAAITPHFPAHGEPFRFAMLSRLDPVKCHGHAVEAAERLIRAGQPVALHIAGEGACGGQLAEMAASRPWLRLAGPVADPAAFLQGKHALLLPSRAEGMPLALAEAMAAGLPAVVSDLPSLRDMAGPAALYAPPGDSDALARTMAALIGDATRWSALSCAARHRAADFDIGVVAARWADQLALIRAR